MHLIFKTIQHQPMRGKLSAALACRGFFDYRQRAHAFHLNTQALLCPALQYAMWRVAQPCIIPLVRSPLPAYSGSPHLSLPFKATTAR